MNFERHRRQFTWVRWLTYLVLLMAAILPAAADPLEEARTGSGLSGLAGPLLLHGDIFSEGGKEGNFSRGAYAESVYYVKAPVATVGTMLLHWDPSKYKKTDVDVYIVYSWPAPVDTFKRLQLSAARPADRQLIDATLDAARGEKGSLHLRPSDDEVLRQDHVGGPIPATADRREGLVNAAWRQILQRRSEAMAAGGLAGVPPYTAGNTSIRAAVEFNSLLKITGGIAARFGTLTRAKPLFADGAESADEAVCYAEQSGVNGHTSLCLGVLAARKSPGAWQVIDCTYYTADTYFVSVSLYQLWPWENGTLVWQVDYVSAPFRSYLGGLDRLFAGKEISKDSAQTVRIFRGAVEGRGH